MGTQPTRRTNAEKRSSVKLMFEALIREVGSLDQIPKYWSALAIAEHCGVSNRLVLYIHVIILGLAAPVKISQEKSKPSRAELD